MRKSIQLTEQQYTFLIGTMLGDGSLVEIRSKNNLRLKIQHGDKQSDYVFWKYEMMKSLVLSPPVFEQRTNSWQFRTISHPSLTKLGDLFYKDRKKIVPPSINQLLTEPMSLAVWFMDDGSKNRNDGLILNTQCFTKHETELLRECLKKNFGIEHISLQADKNGWRLYIQKASTTLMTNIMRPFILPSMMYKMISPVETTRRLPV